MTGRVRNPRDAIKTHPILDSGRIFQAKLGADFGNEIGFSFECGRELRAPKRELGVMGVVKWPPRLGVKFDLGKIEGFWREIVILME